MNKWWGYLHKENTLQVKRYFGPEDIAEAHSSPFVKFVAGPWEVANREEALEKLRVDVKSYYEIIL